MTNLVMHKDYSIDCVEEILLKSMPKSISVVHCSQFNSILKSNRESYRNNNHSHDNKVCGIIPATYPSYEWKSNMINIHPIYKIY